ncbi:helix-turn-helix transcriptional regulator [Cupriavidus necator]|uniref:TetR/AcrR family transcriptional regulator n=1 Tax=Cupriavidus necator TaxID=106590 RepID=A0A367PHA5_CUPNE|nr:helix-turn-helix domain-containing protein [Cupriavidus necator]QQX86673.1 helix-turn-helix transcriptional regulator [Cupriavidus necator]RCJ07249.1 TetR/AcrR family transcriptional regulator [Cupriavidus necator]
MASHIKCGSEQQLRGPKPVRTLENLNPRRGAVLHAAGYKATGVNDIVAAAEASNGSFYNYFENKDIFGRRQSDRPDLRPVRRAFQDMERRKDKDYGRPVFIPKEC